MDLDDLISLGVCMPESHHPRLPFRERTLSAILALSLSLFPFFFPFVYDMPFVIPPPSQQDPTIDDDISSSPILVPTDILDFATSSTSTVEGGNVDVDSSSNTSATTNISLSTPFLPASVTDSNNDDDNDDPLAFLHPPLWLSTRTDSDPYRRYRLPRPPSPIHHHASSRPTSSSSSSSNTSSSSTLRMRHHRPFGLPPQRRSRWSIPAAASSSTNLAISSEETTAQEAARARRRLRAFHHRGIPTRTLRRSYRSLPYCLGDNASSFYHEGIRRSRSTTLGRLDFCVVMEDGGRYR